MQALESKRRRARTSGEKDELLNLPATLATLEVKIQQIAQELGTQEFRELTGTSGASTGFPQAKNHGNLLLNINLIDHRATSLLAVQVAKGQLYCAKVGVVEAYKQADRTKGWYYNDCLAMCHNSHIV